jgi:glutamine amidotransferase
VRRKIGIVDYGAGNIASLHHALRTLNYACKVSHKPAELVGSDLLLLPGVAAFPSAMEALQKYELVPFLREQADDGKPILGICLGMQLLSDSSTEIRPTAGLGLIPGETIRMEGHRFHIGWNTIDPVGWEPLLRRANGHSFYFNHSYIVRVPREFQIATCAIGNAVEPFVVGVRRGNIAGLQFHPEKSQSAGHEVLGDVLEGLLRA